MTNDTPAICIPPDPSVSRWWWLGPVDNGDAFPLWWDADAECWDAGDMPLDDWRILGPVATHAEVEALRAEIQRLRAAFRVNILRLSPASHAEIDAIINGGTTP